MTTTDLDPSSYLSRERAAGYDTPTLSSAKILVAGVGALGQNLAQNLALSGVGTLCVVDHDVFAASNRTRSPVFPSPETQGRLGFGKAVTVAHGLHRMTTAPNRRVLFFNGPVQALGIGVLMEFDAVAAAVDSDMARSYLADACRRAGTPLVLGGFEAEFVQFTVDANDLDATPCWRCSHPIVADDGALSCSAAARLVEAAGFTPATQPAAAALGALMAEATIQLLHGHHDLTGHRVALDVRRGRSQLTKLARDPDCPATHRCDLGTVTTPIELPRHATGRDLLRLLARHGVERPVVTLASEFVETVPCGLCGTTVNVGRPLASLVRAPTCPAGCAPSRDRPALPPVTRPTISADDQDLLDLPCPALGISPFTLLEVADADDSVKLFMPIGTLADVFEEVCTA